MTQPHGEPAAGHGADAGHGGHGDEAFNAGEMIVEHIANSPIDHPLVHLPPFFGIDFSITKHVLMLWLVAATVFTLVTVTVRRYLRQERLVPGGFMTVLEFMVEFIRDSIVVPNVGERYARRWAPLILTFFIFILLANLVGLIPMFEVLGLIDHYVLHTGEDSFLKQLLHGGATATANFNVTARPRGHHVPRDHHRRNDRARVHPALEEPGAARPGVADLLPADPDRAHRHDRQAVRPDAASRREHDGRTHRHSRAPLVRADLRRAVPERRGRDRNRARRIGTHGQSASHALEIIVILVQAYVFTLLTTTFIGMAINVHH